MKYVKKSIVVEAAPVKTLLQIAKNDFESLPDWVREAWENREIKFGFDHILVLTLEGGMRADEVDMLILGIDNEVYPCKPDIFKKTYEAANG